jgi:uncharacterized membrane protein
MMPEARSKTLGWMFFAAGLGSIGVLNLRFGDFAYDWQPMPPNVPMRAALAYVSGAVLLIGALGLIFRKAAKPAAIALAASVSAWLIFLELPRVLARPTYSVYLLGFGETLVLCTGGWVVVRGIAGAAWNDRKLRVLRVLYGAALVLIGQSHFVYLKETASMVPAWLPARPFFAALTGAGHIAAGVAILFGAIPGIAAALEAAMIACFVLLLHLPGVLSAPGNRLQWTILAIATALMGAAWAMAGSYCPGKGTPPDAT